MSSPLISILVPVYNCEQYLDQCITSIINQDYTNLQIVLANDGSSDKSLEICRKYAENDSRIKVLTRPNKGVATTRNDLLDQIEGEYFLFVDADDWIEPNMVSCLLGLIEESRADISVCSKHNGDSTNTPKAEKTTVKKWNQKETIEKFLYHKEISGALWNKLIKTSLIKDNRFDPKIYYGEDALFMWHVLQNLNTLVISNLPLYHQTANLNSLSNTSWKPEKKGTSHRVWALISKEASLLWPEYEGIAKARFALEDMWALYFAAASKYSYDKHIKLRQNTIRENKKALKQYKIDGKEKYFTALALAYCYSSGQLIHWLSKKILGRGI